MTERRRRGLVCRAPADDGVAIGKMPNSEPPSRGRLGGTLLGRRGMGHQGFGTVQDRLRARFTSVPREAWSASTARTWRASCRCYARSARRRSGPEGGGRRIGRSDAGAGRRPPRPSRTNFVGRSGCAVAGSVAGDEHLRGRLTVNA